MSKKRHSARLNSGAGFQPAGGQDARPTKAATISACLIVRDEEANLARCLTSIKNEVDEIVIVDTGSTDGTVGIARSFAAKVFHYEWQDDFAAARNESLRHAKGDWILQIDADEELIQDKLGALRAHCSTMRIKADGFLITVRSPADEGGSAETVGQQCRVFRNQSGVHFEGRIHEQLRAANGETPRGIALAPESLSLHHRGYIDSGDLPRHKGERNRRLLALTIAEDPNQPAHHFNLGRQLVWEGNFEQALPPLRRAIELWTAQGSAADGYVPSMFATAALAANKLARWDSVLELHDRAPEHAVSSELVYVAGVAAWRAGDVERAERLLNRAWQDKSLARGTGLDPSTAGWRPLTALAELYESQGRTEDARQARARLAPSDVMPGEAKNHSAKPFAEPPPEDVILSEAKNLPGPAETIARGQDSSSPPAPQNDIRPSISACLIVRDEEANLPRCMASLRGEVDEIVVVDTGSRDRTAQLAEQLGAKVFHFSWCDDFAAARNESLKHASGDWILWIDADDELVTQQPGALRKLVTEDHPAYWLECHSLSTESGEIGAVTTQCRLFRNHLGIEFRGRIHEQPIMDGTPGSQTLAFIRHWGYIPSGDALDRKCARNRRLLELEIAERPDDAFLYYMLGKQYVWQHNYQPALDVLEQAIGRWQQAGQLAASYVGPLLSVAACSALNLHQLDRTLAFEASCPPQALSSDLLYYAAIACQQMGRLEDALSRLQRATGDPNVRNSVETDPATAGWRSWYLASQICNTLGRGAEAYAAANRAVETMPARPEVLLSFAAMALNSGHPEDARRVAERVLASPAAGEYASRARSLLQQAAIQNRKPKIKNLAPTPDCQLPTPDEALAV